MTAWVEWREHLKRGDAFRPKERQLGQISNFASLLGFPKALPLADARGDYLTSPHLTLLS